MKLLFIFSQLASLNALFNHVGSHLQICFPLEWDKMALDLQMNTVILSTFSISMFWLYFIESVIVITLIIVTQQWMKYNRKVLLFIKKEKNIQLEYNITEAISEYIKQTIGSKHRIIDYYSHVPTFNNIKKKVYPDSMTIEFELYAYIISIINQCRRYAETRQVRLNINKEIGYTSCQINETAMSAALLCLLNKIIGNTPQKGQINITLSHFDKYWYLKITNNIQKEKEDKRRNKMAAFSFILISSYGSLRTIKKIIHLHGGKITISKNGRTLTFQVIVPVNYHYPKAKEPVSQEHVNDISTNKNNKTVTFQTKGNKTPHVLLIMTNKELREYLHTTLSALFRVSILEMSEDTPFFSSIEGHEAVIIDEVINHLHGDKLYERIQSTINISHTPIILLLNHNDNNSHHTDYESDVLKLQTINICKLKSEISILIKSHIALRQRLKRQIINRSSTDISEKMTQVDQDIAFIDKVEKLLEKNLSTEGYTIDMLSTDIGMSRTTFYNKIKDITGKPPIQYMFSFKMNKAKALLITQEYNITEISMLLGYCDAKYFGKKFREYYHVSPTRYIKDTMNKVD